jgi:hypothetical protein
MVVLTQAEPGLRVVLCRGPTTHHISVCFSHSAQKVGSARLKTHTFETHAIPFRLTPELQSIISSGISKDFMNTSSGAHPVWPMDTPKQLSHSCL